MKYDTEVEYWYGYILAYVQWKMNCSFSDILEKISFETLNKLYPALHTVSEERAFDEIEKRIKIPARKI